MMIYIRTEVARRQGTTAAILIHRTRESGVTRPIRKSDGKNAMFRSAAVSLRLSGPQRQYWAGRTLRPNNSPPNMAAANFVVITNGEGCALNGAAVAAVFIDQ